MKTRTENYAERFAFIETLSRELIALTGCGLYVFLNPPEVDRLFDQYRNQGVPIRLFARQYLKNLH